MSRASIATGDALIGAAIAFVIVFMIVTWAVQAPSAPIPVEKPAVVPALARGVSVVVIDSDVRGVIVDWRQFGEWDVRLHQTSTIYRPEYSVVPFFGTELRALPIESAK